MAASGGSTGPLADASEVAASGDPGPVPNEREKTQVAATELVGGSNIGIEEKQQRKTLVAVAGPAEPITSTPPLPPRCHLLPASGKRRRMSKSNVAAKDPRRKLPTVVKPKDSITAESKLHICLPNRTILEGQLLFFNQHYGIALLEISSESDLPLQTPCFGSNPNYDQEVFMLGRGEESNLVARHGKILWFEDPDDLVHNYRLFLSCEPPRGCSGGSVIDNDGNVTGMAFDNGGPYVSILSISTIQTCIEMWMKFSRIARPVHGLSLRTVQLLDVSLQEVISLEHNISNGYIVDMVYTGSTAEKLGIRYGDVIVSFDGLSVQTLPQLEDYLLSLGWGFLQGNTGSSSTVDLKLEVYDLLERGTRSITLAVEFCGASE
ncbi:unnamed protein product [Urochloa humidicola]